MDSSIPKNRNRKKNITKFIDKNSPSSSSSSSSSRKNKSPFFTVGEQIGQELLGNPSLFDLEPLQEKYNNDMISNKKANTNTKTNTNTDSSNYRNPRNSNSNSFSTSNNSIEKEKLLKDIKRLDLILDDLSLELQSIEVSITVIVKYQY